MISTKETGKRIRKLLADSGISVRQVQEQMGLESSQAVYKWLHGKSLPAIKNMLLLSRILGVNMEDLLVDDGESGREPRERDESPVLLLEIGRSENTGKRYMGYQKSLAEYNQSVWRLERMAVRRERRKMPEYTRKLLLNSLRAKAAK